MEGSSGDVEGECLLWCWGARNFAWLERFAVGPEDMKRESGGATAPFLGGRPPPVWRWWKTSSTVEGPPLPLGPPLPMFEGPLTTSDFPGETIGRPPRVVPAVGPASAGPATAAVEESVVDVGTSTELFCTATPNESTADPFLPAPSGAPFAPFGNGPTAACWGRGGGGGAGACWGGCPTGLVGLHCCCICTDKRGATGGAAELDAEGSPPTNRNVGRPPADDRTPRGPPVETPSGDRPAETPRPFPLVRFGEGVGGSPPAPVAEEESFPGLDNNPGDPPGPMTAAGPRASPPAPGRHGELLFGFGKDGFFTKGGLFKSTTLWRPELGLFRHPGELESLRFAVSDRICASNPSIDFRRSCIIVSQRPRVAAVFREGGKQKLSSSKTRMLTGARESVV